MELTYVDLFCGPGGLALGFKDAGFKCVTAIDNSVNAIQTHQNNVTDEARLDEISEFTQLPASTVVIGGPPCQGFSSAGMRQADDKRSSLVGVFASLVVKYKPSAFAFENVEGFLTVDNGSRVLDLLVPVINAGYRVHLRKINAANFGVPQHRKRIIVLGGLGWDPEFPEPTHWAFGAPGASTHFTDLPPCPSFNDAIKDLPEPSPAPPGRPSGHFVKDSSPEAVARISLLKPGQRMRDLPEHLWHDSYRRRAYRRVMDGTPTDRRGGAPSGIRRLDPATPSKAITTGATGEFVHPTSDRFVTPRECARLQTFPDDFTFSASPGQIMTQIGNAVPPKLSFAIATALKASLRTATPTLPSGSLLSFVPTTASGMSPALQRMQQRVITTLSATAPAPESQLQLWP